MADIVMKYGVPVPFISAIVPGGWWGYIKNEYTIDENGICSGILVSEGKSETRVRIIAIDNKPEYKLNTINKSYQLLVMSEDNKYIFPYSPEYTYDSTPQYPYRMPYNPAYTLISIIDAAKKNDFSIPSVLDFRTLFDSLQNVNVPGLSADDLLQLIKKIIHIGSNPTEEINKLFLPNFLPNIVAISTTFSKIYGKDLLDNCISFSTTDISKISKNLSQFDCRNPKSLNLTSFTSGTNLTYIGICCCCCCICIIAIIIIVMMMSSSKKKFRRRGGYYF
jgi:hypothetical protein